MVISLGNRRDEDWVEFGFTAEQQALASLAREVAESLSGLSGRDAGMSDIDFGVLVQTGLCGLLVPEPLGGSGATLVEAGIVAEQLGRTLAPAVIAGSFLIAPVALGLVADDAERKKVAASIVEGRPCCVVVDSSLSWPPEVDGLAWGWHPKATVLVPGGGVLHPANAVNFPVRPTEDLSLLLANVRELTPTRVADQGHAGQLLLAAANIVLSCVLLGHMRAVLERSAAYALDREQFGAKIGSFQAVKAILAEMLVDSEASHSIAYGAAAIAAQADDIGVASRAAAAAKAWCGDAAVRVCESAIQVHGGVGFTWEVPIHRYLRAAHLARVSFMSPDQALDLTELLDRTEGLNAWI